MQVETVYADGSSDRVWKTLKPADFNCNRVGGWCVELGGSSDEEAEVVDAAADGYDSADSDLSSVCSSDDEVSSV